MYHFKFHKHMNGSNSKTLRVMVLKTYQGFCTIKPNKERERCQQEETG